jgi:hypothetical protein
MERYLDLVDAAAGGKGDGAGSAVAINLGVTRSQDAGEVEGAGAAVATPPRGAPATKNYNQKSSKLAWVGAGDEYSVGGCGTCRRWRRIRWRGTEQVAVAAHHYSLAVVAQSTRKKDKKQRQILQRRKRYRPTKQKPTNNSDDEPA